MQGDAFYVKLGLKAGLLLLLFVWLVVRIFFHEFELCRVNSYALKDAVLTPAGSGFCSHCC